MTAKAVIVGIERYEDESLNVDTPALNALAIAHWARASGIAARDIFLFVSAIKENFLRDFEAQERHKQESERIIIYSPDERTLDDVLRTAIPLAADRSGLLFYWSGHGLTDPLGQRVLLCADYTPLKANRVFNASLFLRKMRTDQYQNYNRLLLLADVCGTNSRMPIEAEAAKPGAVFKRDQLVYFATPEGSFAKANTGEGAFTHHCLKVLGNFRQFPDFSQFKEDLENELQKSNLPRFLLEISTETDAREERFGRATPTADPSIDILVERLVALRVRYNAVRPHFEATVATLGNPRILAAEGLTGMVRELSGLRDEDTSATHGLVQFVLRVAHALPEVAIPLQAWLDCWAKREIIDFEQERLEEESGRGMLIVDVESDRDGAILALYPSLRTLDQARLLGNPLKPIKGLTDWQDVETNVLNLLDQLKNGGFSDLEIHFIVEPTVFDRPFHRISDLERRQLGAKFGVVLHHRERILPRTSPAKRAWTARLKHVLGVDPKTLTWMRCAANTKLPLDPSLCIAEQPPTGPGRMVLSKLVQLGAVGIYWPHEDGEADAEEDLNGLLGRPGMLGAMPDQIRLKRIADVSDSGSLLWDTIQFRPYGG